MMKIKISAISYYLPVSAEDESNLQQDNPDWIMPKIIEKTGIYNRYIAAIDETASDLAYLASEKLFKSTPVRDEIDLLILVTQSPDYILPTSACILQDRLKLSTKCMAFDINLGCSGFVYALSVAGGLIDSKVVKKALILCADTYSKYIAKNDRTCRPIFSDGAAAILIEESNAQNIGPFEFGTDGAGYDRLIVKNGGARELIEQKKLAEKVLEMHGSDIFLFTMRVIPICINNLLNKANLTINQINLFVFHQASKLVIDNLIGHLCLKPNQVFTNYETVGNTVSASIPIALKDAETQGRLKEGDIIMLIGFGVGLSWGATLLHWTATS